MILRWIDMQRGLLSDELYEALMGAHREVHVDAKVVRDVDFGWRVILFTLTGEPEVVMDAAERIREVYNTEHGTRENGSWWGR